MNRSAGIAGSYSLPAMTNSLRIVQLNVKKQGTIHDSLMNDEDLQDAAVIMIQEPQARNIGGHLITTPMAHHKWTKMAPQTWSEGRWAVRSMLWVNRDLEAEQVHTNLPDLTAAVIRLDQRIVLVASVYVAGQDEEALQEMCSTLRKLILDTKLQADRPGEVVIAGDFNRHDQLWMAMMFLWIGRAKRTVSSTL